MTNHDPNLHLFVDEQSVYQTFGVTRILNQAVKHPQPVVMSDGRPHRMATAWGNVIQESDGRLRMWYLDMFRDPHGAGKAGVWGRGSDYGFHPRDEQDCRDVESVFMAYAESTDGIHWEKPELGLIEYRGCRRNNLVMSGELGARQTGGALTNFDGFTIVRDEAEPDAKKRYKMIAHWESVHCWDNSVHQTGRADADMKRFWEARAKYLTTSRDGIHWDAPLTRLFHARGDRMLVMRDHRHQQWWMSDRPPLLGVPFGQRWVRGAGLSTSPDLLQWSQPSQQTLALDERDDFGQLSQFHTFMPFNYGSQDLGFATMVNSRSGCCRPYLLSHRDGQPWQRHFRDQPVIERGSPGAFDRVQVVPLHNEPIVLGDEMFVYYSAGAALPGHPSGARSIGVARLRRDAFVGLAAVGYTPHPSIPNSLGGEVFVVSNLVEVGGESLWLNFEKLNAAGQCRTALLNPDLSAIEGFTLDQCEPVTEDGVLEHARWKDRESLAGLRGRSIRVQFQFTSGVLYAFRFANLPSLQR
ncbi:MAG: hypothetical protein HYU36_14555 [Planctomycetes bacterium]|nr:hypothetical protein [Planctomycetota bacterium]